MPATAPAGRELFVFTLAPTTHGGASTGEVQAVRWDFPFDEPDLPTLFAYSNLCEAEARAAADVVLRQVADVVVAAPYMTQPLRALLPYDKRVARGTRFGPYWVLLPAPLTPLGNRYNNYYAHFHQWVCAQKRKVKPKNWAVLREAFAPHLIFNKETDDAITRLSQAGSCPIREWNLSTFGRAAGDRQKRYHAQNSRGA